MKVVNLAHAVHIWAFVCFRGQACVLVLAGSMIGLLAKTVLWGVAMPGCLVSSTFRMTLTNLWYCVNVI